MNMKNKYNKNENIEQEKNSFVQIPNQILTSDKLPDEVFRTLCVLLSFRIKDNPTFPSLKTISIRRHKSINSISNHIRILREIGLISSKKRGYSQSNQYFFNFTVGSDIDMSMNSNIPTSSDSIYQSAGNTTPSQLVTNNNNVNIDIKNKKISSFEEMETPMDKIRNKHRWLNHLSL